MNGKVIPGLYCAGESAGGFNQHGMGRCVTQGFIAGVDAARLSGTRGVGAKEFCALHVKDQ